MASAARPSKRPRAEGSSAASDGDTSRSVLSLEELERDEDLWLEDGSVVLVARKIAFKVYKGLLSAHSPVFSNMFASANADETFDGTPVVRLTDSPKDLKWLLLQLIPKIRLPMEPAHPSEGWELPALARLAHKYQIDVIERLAIDRLKCVFTNGFEAWSHPDPLRASYEAYNAIDIVQLARLTNNPSMLPVAFYSCIQRVHIIVDGMKREDGTLVFLDKADAKLCILAFGELCRTSDRMFQQTFLTPPSDACKTPAKCRDVRERMVEKSSRSPHKDPLKAGPLWAYIMTSLSRCDACAGAVFERDKVARRELWKDLPRTFRLRDEVKGFWPGC